MFINSKFQKFSFWSFFSNFELEINFFGNWNFGTKIEILYHCALYTYTKWQNICILDVVILVWKSFVYIFIFLLVNFWLFLRIISHIWEYALLMISDWKKNPVKLRRVWTVLIYADLSSKLRWTKHRSTLTLFKICQIFKI